MATYFSNFGRSFSTITTEIVRVYNINGFDSIDIDNSIYVIENDFLLRESNYSANSLIFPSSLSDLIGKKVIIKNLTSSIIELTYDGITIDGEAVYFLQIGESKTYLVYNSNSVITI